MDLETDRTTIRHAKDVDIERIFEDDSMRGEFAILSVSKEQYLQAAGEGEGPYLLEYRVPDSGNCQAEEKISKQEVVEAFLDYLRGGTQWRSARQWQELEGGLGSGRSIRLHLVLMIGSQVAGFIAGAIVAAVLVFRWGTHSLLITGGTMFGAIMVGVMVPYFLFKVIPARCPRCGGRAYWKSSNPVTYVCPSCGQDVRTSVYESGSHTTFR